MMWGHDVWPSKHAWLTRHMAVFNQHLEVTFCRICGDVKEVK